MSADTVEDVVGRFIAAEWVINLEENSPDQISAAIRWFGIRLGSYVEIAFGDDEVLALANVFREAGDAMETELGRRMHRGVVNRAKAGLRPSNTSNDVEAQ